MPGAAFAAAYADLGAQTERVVEGHNAYAVVQAVVNRNITGVTVLVREVIGSQGKLWFNDQYLVAPDEMNTQDPLYNSTSLSRLAATRIGDCAFRQGGTTYSCVRYPCGGAVLAVESGSPDPIRPYSLEGRSDDPDTSERLNGTQREIDETFLNLDPDRDFTSTRDEYVESYLVTDPNDNAFVVDKYVQTRYFHPDVSASPGLLDAADPVAREADETAGEPYVMRFFVWVVNILGSPVFIVDDGAFNCNPYIDYPTLGSTFYEPTDPSANGGASYCYDGNPALNGEAPGAGCEYDAYDRNETFLLGSQERFHNYRRYNAELVFYMEDFVATARGAKAHGGASTDTNGCEADARTLATGRYGGERNWTGPSPTEWYCPDHDDDAEGNSHPFNPLDDGARTLDHVHDTARIDLYFSSNFRPREPETRVWRIHDVEGHPAPFDLRHAP